MGTSNQQPSPDNILTKELVRNLNEHCIGGFVLFYFNKEGLPRQAIHFDSNVHGLAMQKYMSDCIYALNDLYIEGAKEDYMNINENPQNTPENEDGSE